MNFCPFACHRSIWLFSLTIGKYLNCSVFDGEHKVSVYGKGNTVAILANSGYFGATRNQALPRNFLVKWWTVRHRRDGVYPDADDASER